MPQTRPLPLLKQPLKTERTHEENQERAYIAASRRSDRSLEARIESARRASEIHKRRTGRSLRVSEQDVLNEEMYEEEDDDLPLQYRRLTAHLNTASPDLNRRLAAYVTNQVAIRNALALTSGFSQSSSSVQQWGPSNFEAAMPWLQRQQALQTQQLDSVSSPQSTPVMDLPASPNDFQSAFAAPIQHQHHFEHHQPSTSPSLDQTQTNMGNPLAGPGSNKRRASFAIESSTPTHHASSPRIAAFKPKARSFSTSLLPTLKIQSIKKGDGSTARQNPERPSKRVKQSRQNDIAPRLDMASAELDPLTTQLPPETQMFLQPWYEHFPTAPQAKDTIKSEDALAVFANDTMPVANDLNALASQNGINQTLALAPSMLDYDGEFGSAGVDPWSAMEEELASNGDTNSMRGFDNSYGNETFLKSHAFDSELASGQDSPFDKDWSAYLNISALDDETDW